MADYGLRMGRDCHFELAEKSCARAAAPFERLTRFGSRVISAGAGPQDFFRPEGTRRSK